jgi:hypothetical protein
MPATVADPAGVRQRAEIGMWTARVAVDGGTIRQTICYV